MNYLHADCKSRARRIFFFLFLVAASQWALAKAPSENLDEILRQARHATEVRMFFLPLKLRANAVQEAELLSSGCELILIDKRGIARLTQLIELSKPHSLPSPMGWEPLNGIYFLLPTGEKIKILLGQNYAPPHDFRFGTIAIEAVNGKSLLPGVISHLDGSFEIVESQDNSKSSAIPIRVNKELVGSVYSLAVKQRSNQGKSGVMERGNCSNFPKKSDFPPN
ncbi:hypothetical protein AB4142_25635 [Variovorax sp. 2RAF20]|uniref:hypothetical protein n=1 Tax=Variovorax sp. CF313 TaxID=1144315 RepID=UPI00027110E0|nr:hypothetical protein [Variovorax sp. CF313]EJL79285.1 hypothetical protein PMI12_00725 [Variovorax sp. CF313]